MFKCIECDNELKRIETTLKQKSEKGLKRVLNRYYKEFGTRLKIPQGYHCIKCGLMYTESLVPLETKLNIG